MFQRITSVALSRPRKQLCGHNYLLLLVSAGWLWILQAAALSSAAIAADTWSVLRDNDRGRIQIDLGGKPFATYTYRDSAIPRPYFANIYSPSGIKITRNHPPAANDPQDHDKIHPGMWLAFGDLSGADSWRLAAPVEHIRFVSEPAAKGNTLKFAVENKYLAADRKHEICREICQYTFLTLPDGVLVNWDSDFHSSQESFVFGDQEELGVGVRLAKPIAVKSGQGGRILNSNGQKNEKGAWGQQADWCDYSGTIGDEFIGILLMPHPDNFRMSWCHARDTGFMAMNPFGKNAFTGGEKSAIVVPPGKSFRLRYGVLFHWNKRPNEFDPRRAYEQYVKFATKSPGAE